MARRVIVMPSQSEVEERAFDSWLPGQGLLQESLALAGIVFVAGEVVIFGVAYVFLPLEEAIITPLAALPLLAAVAAMVALLLAVYRVLRYERREKRHLEMMDLQVAHLRRQVLDDEDPGSGGRPAAYTAVGSDSRRWNQIAYEMLRRYYATLARTHSREAAARAISRDACVKAGLCNQKEWNVVNRLFVARGLRRGRKRGLTPRTFEEAWRIWQRAQANVSSWYVEDDMWIPKE